MNAGGHIIIGTAGHVDHGKTELTAALTGIHTDRLPEEKRRGMTIVPGFVPLTLRSGRRLGLIDVPGHEKFVKNMLAGVAGIDMVLFVVAADEGVMPQTVEHLHILHLLGINKGVVAITKCDLVDAEWLELIREQVAELLAPTSLADAPVIAVSSVTGENIEELRSLLDEVAATVPERSCVGHCRLPLDRVFSKAGFGTVGTGTLWAGKLENGQKVQLWPSGGLARVRGLQVHGDAVETALAGQRTAVNLAGPAAESAQRGGWLAEPGLLRESFRIDIELRLLATARPLTQRSRLRIHHGTSEALGRVNLLDREELKPGESCFAQLQLETPLPPLRGDRMILRAYSPMITIGGATVLDADPPRHKRYQQLVLDALAKKAAGDDGENLLDLLRQAGAPLSSEALAQAAQAPQAELMPYLTDFLAAGRICSLDVDGETQYWLPETEEMLRERTAHMLADYHAKYPLRRGLPAAELRSRCFSTWKQKQLQALLAVWQAAGVLVVDGAILRSPDFSNQPDTAQESVLQRIAAAYAEAPFAPPDWNELMRQMHIPADSAAEYQLWLVENGWLIRAGELFFSSEAIRRAEEICRGLDGADGFTLAMVRDALATSRKYVQAILEYLDEEKITKREGDIRRFLQ